MSSEKESCVNCVVIDNGSNTIKVGYGGENEPITLIPTIIGVPRYRGVMVSSSMSRKNRYIGEEAQAKCGIISLNRPIERGIITNWENMVCKNT